jgi:hypothetical protein
MEMVGTERNPFFENMCTYLGRKVIRQKLIGSFLKIEKRKKLHWTIFSRWEATKFSFAVSHPVKVLILFFLLSNT